jgi:hypothetical protein
MNPQSNSESPRNLRRNTNRQPNQFKSRRRAFPHDSYDTVNSPLTPHAIPLDAFKYYISVFIIILRIITRIAIELWGDTRAEIASPGTARRVNSTCAWLSDFIPACRYLRPKFKVPKLSKLRICTRAGTPWNLVHLAS